MIGTRLRALFPMPGAPAAVRGDDFQLLPRENARGRGSRLLLTVGVPRVLT